MTWRDEPLTKGEFVDALTAAIEGNDHVKEKVFSSYPGLKKNQPGFYEIMQLIFLNDEKVLAHMREFIQVEGAIQDAISNGDHEERDPDSGAAGPGQP